MTRCIVRVLGAADGSPTPHDGRFVVAWDPHTPFGVLALTSTKNRRRARVFDMGEVARDFGMISHVEPVRPDRRPNRPLSGLNLSLEKL